MTYARGTESSRATQVIRTASSVVTLVNGERLRNVGACGSTIVEDFACVVSRSRLLLTSHDFVTAAFLRERPASMHE